MVNGSVSKDHVIGPEEKIGIAKWVKSIFFSQTGIVPLVKSKTIVERDLRGES